MRLWHEDLITLLPKKQIGGQWSEIIGMLGKGWGKKHRVVDHVFTHTKYDLLLFAHYIYREGRKRGFNFNYSLLGKALSRSNTGTAAERREMLSVCRQAALTSKIYKEHDNNYLLECIENLKNKGIEFEEERE
jgi:uncharacterized protein (TIGR02328 family)